MYQCCPGAELRNQIEEGDSGKCAEGQSGLRELHQGKEVYVYTDFKHSKRFNFIFHLNVSLQDYETDLASYTSGLETLLNIPIKRTMLRSPAMDLNQEVKTNIDVEGLFFVGKRRG